MKKAISLVRLKLKATEHLRRTAFNVRSLPICAGSGSSVSQHGSQGTGASTPVLLSSFDSSCGSHVAVREFHALSTYALYHPLRQPEGVDCCLPKTFREQIFLSQLRESHRMTNERTQKENLSKRVSSSSSQKEGKDIKDSENKEESLTLYQRFKRTYKEHGKVLVCVHLATSAVWFGSFYAFATCGIDIVPFLESWNCPEYILSKLRTGGVGNIAVAYLLYKIATPARYTVTIGGTNLAIKYLRREGKMEPMRDEDKLRSMYKEGKANLKHRKDVRVTKFNKNKFMRSYRKMRTRLRRSKKH